MAGDDLNPAVIVSRLNRLESDLNEHGATLSTVRERLNIMEQQKLSRSEFDHWTESAGEWRELVVAHLAKIDSRLGLWAAGSVVLTLIAAAIAAIVGRSP